jgi:hypothetical protein
VELSALAASRGDEEAIEALAATQRRLEKEQAEYAGLLPTVIPIPKNLRARTQELNGLIRTYNAKCMDRRHPACSTALASIQEWRSKIESASKVLAQYSQWGRGLLARAAEWRAGLEGVLREIRAPGAAAGPLEPQRGTSLAAVAAPREDAAAFAKLLAEGEPARMVAASARATRAVQALPAGLPSEPQGGAARLDEEALAPASGGFRWEPVRVRRQFGPFCWTRCCWRRVPALKRV